MQNNNLKYLLVKRIERNWVRQGAMHWLITLLFKLQRFQLNEITSATELSDFACIRKTLIEYVDVRKQ